MNVLYLIRDLTGPIVFFAAIIGLLAQPQILSRVSLTGGVRESAMLILHRWVGRFAVAGLVAVGLAWSLASTEAASPRKPGILAHGILCAICAVTVLRKAWVGQRRAQRGTRQLLLWATATLTLGSSFVVLTSVLAVGHWADPATAMHRSRWLVRQAGTVGHIGLGITLIWMGRLALKNPPAAGGG